MSCGRNQLFGENTRHEGFWVSDINIKTAPWIFQSGKIWLATWFSASGFMMLHAANPWAVCYTYVIRVAWKNDSQVQITKTKNECPLIERRTLNPAGEAMKPWSCSYQPLVVPKCVVSKSSFNRQELFENMLKTTAGRNVNSTGNWCKTDSGDGMRGSKWYKLSFFGRYRLRYLWFLPIYLQKIQLPWTWLTGYWSWGVPCRSFSGLVVGLNSQAILLATHTVDGRHPAPPKMKPCK